MTAFQILLGPAMLGAVVLAVLAFVAWQDKHDPR